jgi:hypothetical protein
MGSPGGGDQATDRAALLRRHRPVIQYDSQESYSADAPAALADVRGNQLKRTDGTVLAVTGAGGDAPALTLDLLRGGNYSDGRPVEHDDYLDAVSRDYVKAAHEAHTVPGVADQVCAHAVEGTDGRLWLQYWCFYYYNDKAFLGFGLHEGDWEMVQVGLGANDQPEQVTYAQHKEARRCAWDEVERDDTEDGPAMAPVVYSARGSHASYFTTGRFPGQVVSDHNDGGGPKVRADVLVLDDAGPPWASWPGYWGSTRATNPLESDSPRGPVEHGQWGDPADFHRDAAPRDDSPPPPAARPPAPLLAARRDGNRAVIDYSFPAAGGDGAAATPERIVLTLDAHGDGRPPSTYAFDVRGEHGTIEHPLPLEDRSYEVRASAAGEPGVAGPTATASLAEPG